MRLEDEIFFLKRALREYRISYWTSFFTSKYIDKYYTSQGFCRYFWMKNRTELNDLPRLTEFARKKLNDLYGYWFPEGKLGPRIKLLKKTLRSINKDIRNAK